MNLQVGVPLSLHCNTSKSISSAKIFLAAKGRKEPSAGEAETTGARASRPRVQQFIVRYGSLDQLAGETPALLGSMPSFAARMLFLLSPA
jgi:hypothetical protein